MTNDSLPQPVGTVETDQAWAEHYGETVIQGLAEYTLTAERAEFLARMAGSFARRVIGYWNAAADDRVVSGVFGGRR